MAVNPSPLGVKEQIQLSSGLPAVGGLLFFYVAGSTSTKQNTYTDSTGGVANTNPIVLDANGFPTNTQVWFTAGQSYKVVYAPAGDTDPPSSPIWTVDNLRGINDTSVTIDQWISSGQTPTYVSTVQFTMPGDQTSAFHANRRLKFTVTAGTVYGTISTSVFGALTTVTMTMDTAQVLDSGLSAVQLALLTATNPSEPQLISAGTGITVTYASGKPTIASTSTTTTVPRLLQNVGLAVTMGASAATIALKGADGNDPSASNSVAIGFRSATLTSGASNTRAVTAALSTVISSGSTGGTVNAIASRIWIAAIDNAGTPELAWYNSGNQSMSLAPDEGAVITTTAEGGAGAADSAQTWYSTTARTSVPFTIIGYFDSTQATAGTWATGVTDIVVNPVHNQGATLGTPVASTSGTSIDFTGIPAGVKRVTISFVGVSTNGTSSLCVQIGPSSGIESTTYLSAAQHTGTGPTQSTISFIGIDTSEAAASVIGGVFILTLENSTNNTWASFSALYDSNVGLLATGTGTKAIAGPLSKVRITTIGGANTFDAGEINILYE